MQLILVRHAAALDRKIAAKKKLPDSKRPLTSKGIRDFKKFLDSRRDLFEKADLLISSPYERALETAHILKSKIYKKKSVTLNSDVLPESDPENFAQYLKKTKASRLVVVTHEPFMSALMVTLLKSPDCFRIKKGAVAVISIENNTAQLCQLSNP